MEPTPRHGEDPARSDDSGRGPPIPARMVAEYAYCPRLFHLEWVQGLWEENEYTEEGADVHRRVDVPSGMAPEPSTEARAVARSVELSSERLGVVVAYDIREPGRLRAVYEEMFGWGRRLQYSVYVCDLTRGELLQMRRRLLDLIDTRADSVVILDLGVPESPHAVQVETLGIRPELPENGAAIF